MDHLYLTTSDAIPLLLGGYCVGTRITVPFTIGTCGLLVIASQLVFLQFRWRHEISTRKAQPTFLRWQKAQAFAALRGFDG